jgi:hypothetical protein
LVSHDDFIKLRSTVLNNKKLIELITSKVKTNAENGAKAADILE